MRAIGRFDLSPTYHFHWHPRIREAYRAVVNRGIDPEGGFTVWRCKPCDHTVITYDAEGLDA